jgi:mannose/fructose/N-acetylgalactosamine-specific phosphotransferase system component IID
MDKENQKVNIFKIFLHSLFIQTVWNYKSMVSVGFTFSLWARCKHILTDKNEKIAFLKRHLSFFNTHPYMATYAIGAIIRLEEEYKKTGNPDINSIDKLKNALIGPLGAIGDQVFWQSMKPGISLLGLLGLMLTDHLWSRLFILVLMLLIYNIPHFVIRYRGLKIGYEQGFSVYKYVKIEKFKYIISSFKIVGAVSLGFLLPVLLIKNKSGELENIIFFFLVFVLTYFIRKNTSNIYYALLIPLILSLIVGFIMVKL